MITQFIKEGEIKSFVVENGKVLTLVNINGLSVINPTIDEFINSGWEECQTQESEYIPTLEELVEKLIRQRYTLNKELQIHRKRDADPEQFDEYYQYVEQCINEARNQQYRQE